jgi:FkbM family methyltransferase
VSAIRRNFELNGIRSGAVVSVALGETSGSGDLLVTKWDGGSSLSSAAIPADERVEHRPVTVAALDDLVRSEKMRPPTFVKIDVEGAELDVLRGMTSTLAEFQPTLVYEVDDANSTMLARRWAELDRLVGSLGYEVTHLADSYSNVHWYVGHSLATPRGSSPAPSSVRS